MNILFFLKPKSEVACVEDDYSVRQTLEKMDYHKYTAVPLLNRKGEYIGTLTEGDLLRYIKNKHSLNLQEAEDINIMKVPRRWYNHPVNINCNMEDLFQTAMKQNFVPVTDDNGTFIGIICRADIMQYYYQNVCENGQKVSRENIRGSVIPSMG